MSTGAKKGPSLFAQLRQSVFSTLERYMGRYITVHFRPIYSKDFNRISFSTPTLPSYAVVLQGPLVIKNDFTLETVRIYKKTFPNAPLIVSTWSDAPADTIAALRAEGAEVVLSELPPYRGFGNSNYQIASSVAGLRKAEELGTTYVFKTRTDQRMYATDIYPFLYELIQSFPLANLGTLQKRIVALGYSTIKYRPYSLNDMFFFGTLSDIKLYWDIPYDMREVPGKIQTIGEWQQHKGAEGYFLGTFLKNIGHDIQNTLEDFWGVLGNYFILIDPSDIDWYWFKYTRYQEYHYRNYQKVIVGEEVSFKEWLMLQQGLAKFWPKPVNLENVPNDTHGTEVLFK